MKKLSVLILTVLVGLFTISALQAARMTKDGHLYNRHWHVESAKEANQVCSVSVGDKVEKVGSIVWSGTLYVRLQVLGDESEDCKGWTKPENYRQ